MDVGIREGDKVQLLNGVRPGESVVIVGGLGVEDKAKVKVLEQKEEADDEDAPPEPGAGKGRQERRGETESQMSDLSSMTPPPAPPSEPEKPHWTAAHGKPIIFVILTLMAVGVYLAVSIPVAVFPETNFPRIVVGVDNGVFPIDQMLVTVTKPLEEAVNSVPGLDKVWSRHQPRHGRDRPVLRLERGHVPHARAGERGSGAGAIVPAGHGENHIQPPDVRRLPHHGVQPDLGQRPADRSVGDGHLRLETAPEPPARRFHHRGAGRPGARIPSAARPRQAHSDRHHRPQHPGRHHPHQHDRLAGPDRNAAPVGAQPGERPDPHSRRDLQHRGETHARRRARAHRRISPT